jgi:hypothetical protein
VLSGGLLHNASFVNHFTRQYMTNDVAHSNLLPYFKNSQLVSQAIQHAYIDVSSNLNDQDHIGWCNVDVKVDFSKHFLFLLNIDQKNTVTGSVVSVLFLLNLLTLLTFFGFY